MDVKEEWKPVVGYEGLYKVSNLGNVYSLPRTVVRNFRGTEREYRIGDFYLKKSLIRRGTGYWSVKLTKDGKGKRCYVHLLVAEAFIPKREKNVEVNHKDLDSKNNLVANLEWVTHLGNMDHAAKNGATWWREFKIKCPELALATSGSVEMEKALKAKGYSADARNIINCARGKRNSHCGLTFTCERL